MPNKILLSSVIFLLFSFAANSQKVLDSLNVTNFPVKQGVIYNYDPRVSVCIRPSSGVTIVTACDSVVHFESGVVENVIRLEGECMAVIIKNENRDYVAYSNLRSVNVSKGMTIARGDLIGMVVVDDDKPMRELDMVILPGAKEISYRQCINYMKSL